MLRIMVVEDEPPILNSICSLLEEYDSVEVVCRAINGRRALEYLEAEGGVDLVFSDIKMPVLDGLELARHIQRDYPAIVMVLLSGFQEFEFARSAIQYGVKNYLLKPVSRERVGEVLAQVMDELESWKLNEYRNGVRSMVMGTVPPRLHLPAGPYGVLVLCEGAFPSQLDEEAGEVARRAYDNAGVEEYLRGLAGGMGVVVNGLSPAERVVVFATDGKRRAEEIAALVYGYVEPLCEGPLTGLARLYEGPGHTLVKCFSKMRARLYRQVCMFHPGFAFGEDTMGREALQPDVTDWTRGLARAIKTRSAEQILAEAETFADRLAHQPVAQPAVLMLLERLVINSFQPQLAPGEMNDLLMQMQGALVRALTPAQLAVDLADVFCAWAENEPSGGSPETGRLCEAVAAHIRETHSQNISTQELAEKFDTSAAQLSKRFKQHFGVSVSEYTNNFRVEVACAVLRENSRARIKEIAIDVGFSDQYYFSKIFKKVTGVWPTEYLQNQNGE